MNELHAKAKKAGPKRIGFPEADDEKVLRAARQACDLGVAFSVLVGSIGVISFLATGRRISLDGMQIIDHTDDTKLDGYIAEYVKIKADFPEKALKLKCKDPLYLALVLEEIGLIDGVVAGMTHTTADVILAAQVIIGMKEGIETTSSVGIWSIPGYEGPEGKFVAHADCAVNPDPSAAELADIAISSADT